MRTDVSRLPPVGGPLWLYDGLCGFCSWSVRFLLRHEAASTTRFIAIQSNAGRDLALRFGVDPDDPSTFLFVEGDAGHAKSDGVIALARHLRWPWRALTWWRFMPRAWRDGLYDVVARNRYRIFGRRTACESPPPHIRARFVLPD